MSQPSEKKPNLILDIFMGLLMSVLGMAAAFGAVMAVGSLGVLQGGWPVFAIFAGTGGIYFVLTIRWAYVNRRQGIMIGLIVGAALFVLLASACYTLVRSF